MLIFDANQAIKNHDQINSIQILLLQLYLLHLNRC